MLDWLLKRKLTPMAEALETEYPLVAVGQGGFLSGTTVASNLGWRPIEALVPGDEALTFDNGLQPILSLHKEPLVASDGVAEPLTCPVYIPQDALNNRAPMWVMPDQGVLIESDLYTDELGDPFVVVPACALEGYRGIHRAQPGFAQQVIVPRFARDEVIYLEAGLLGMSVRPRDLLDCAMSPVADQYRVLPAAEARSLVVEMITQENIWASTLPMGPGGQGAAEFAALS
ncbi:Hint domain-containing protein [Phaeobacter sp.]|uniref:Hint domain-containing protein n=1 Tax=Phaeobacter sp. TaxID=1902409 RepID=UPI0025EDD1CF|nr:Hint domain-containing protein [Phaeobacter sp.]